MCANAFSVIMAYDTDATSPEERDGERRAVVFKTIVLPPRARVLELPVQQIVKTVDSAPSGGRSAFAWTTIYTFVWFPLTDRFVKDGRLFVLSGCHCCVAFNAWCGTAADVLRVASSDGSAYC